MHLEIVGTDTDVLVNMPRWDTMRDKNTSIFRPGSNSNDSVVRGTRWRVFWLWRWDPVPRWSGPRAEWAGGIVAPNVGGATATAQDLLGKNM